MCAASSGRRHCLFASLKALSASSFCTHAHADLIRTKPGNAPHTLTRLPKLVTTSVWDLHQAPGARSWALGPARGSRPDGHAEQLTVGIWAAAMNRTDVNKTYVCKGDPRGGWGEQGRAVSITLLLHLDGEIQSLSQNRRVSQAAHLTNQFLRLERIIMVISV